MSAITVSEQAKTRLQSIAAENQKSAVRVSVVPKGCSGYAIKMDFVEQPYPKYDDVIQLEGVDLVVDSASVMFLFGSQLDWHDDGMQSHFHWINPNEKGRCGCGESFAF